MNNTVTICRIENNDGVYTLSYPEYPDCPQIADTDIKDLVQTASVFLSTFVILQKNGEFSFHTRPLKEYIESGNDIYSAVISCDLDIIEDTFKELNISIEAFFNYIMDHTDSILNDREEIFQPEQNTQNENKDEKEEIFEKPSTSSIKDTVKQEQIKTNDITNFLDDGEDGEFDEFASKKKRKKKN